MLGHFNDRLKASKELEKAEVAFTSATLAVLLLEGSIWLRVHWLHNRHNVLVLKSA